MRRTRQGRTSAERTEEAEALAARRQPRPEPPEDVRPSSTTTKEYGLPVITLLLALCRPQAGSEGDGDAQAEGDGRPAAPGPDTGRLGPYNHPWPLPGGRGRPGRRPMRFRVFIEVFALAEWVPRLLGVHVHGSVSGPAEVARAAAFTASVVQVSQAA